MGSACEPSDQYPKRYERCHWATDSRNERGCSGHTTVREGSAGERQHGIAAQVNPPNTAIHEPWPWLDLCPDIGVTIYRPEVTSVSGKKKMMKVAIWRWMHPPSA